MHRLFVVMLVAGCTQTAMEPNVSFEPATASWSTDYGGAVRLTTVGVAEPGVVAGPDGTLYANVWSQFFRSDDGVTWTGLSPTIDVSGDTSLAVGPDGVVHAVAMALASDDGPRLPYIRSNDRGATWSEPVELASTASNIDRPWIAALSDNRLLVAWNSFEDKETPVRISPDGGGSWDDAVTPSDAHYRVLGAPVPTSTGALIPVNGFSSLLVFRLQGDRWDVLEGPKAEVGTFSTIPSVAMVGDTIWIASTLESTDPAAMAFSSNARDFTGMGWTSVRLFDRPSLMPWLQPTSTGVLATAYVRSGVPAAVPTTILNTWNVEAAHVERQAVETAVIAQDVHLGNMCTSGAGCSASDWTFRDYFQTAVRPDGSLVVPYPVDAPGGVDVMVRQSRES